MKITRIDSTQAKPEPSRANDFDGEVSFQTLISPVDSEELDLTNVCFSAGARTRPHIQQKARRLSWLGHKLLGASKYFGI